MEYKSISVPSYVQNKTHEVQKTWSHVSKMAGGGSNGVVVANKWLQRHRAKTFIKRSIIEFEIVKDGEFIKRDDSGEEYMTFKLKSTKDKDNVKWSAKLLQKWTDMINSGKSIIGDIDHKLYDSLLDTSTDAEFIKRMIENKHGIAKTVKAIFENGIMYIRTFIDKRYKKLIQRAKGLSVEAFIEERAEDGTIVEADLLGFTFNVNTEPADPVAGVL